MLEQVALCRFEFFGDCLGFSRLDKSNTPCRFEASICCCLCSSRSRLLLSQTRRCTRRSLCTSTRFGSLSWIPSAVFLCLALGFHFPEVDLHPTAVHSPNKSTGFQSIGSLGTKGQSQALSCRARVRWSEKMLGSELQSWFSKCLG